MRLGLEHRHRFDVVGTRRGAGDMAEEIGRCPCGLEERRRFTFGQVAEIRYRWRGTGAWTDPVELLTLDLPVALCGVCRGRGCTACRNLGVVGSRV